MKDLLASISIIKLTTRAVVRYKYIICLLYVSLKNALATLYFDLIPSLIIFSFSIIFPPDIHSTLINYN